jgi:hypothetical protein
MRVRAAAEDVAPQIPCPYCENPVPLGAGFCLECGNWYRDGEPLDHDFDEETEHE